MKRIKFLLFTLIIMMFISVVDVNAAGVSIKNIKLVDHTGNTTEINEPILNGLTINFDLAFGNIGDTATYEVVLNNPTNKEYEINTEKKFSGSNYISYSYELKDKMNRIKANSEVTLNIIIKYEHAVPPEKLVNGQYVEKNDLGISLLNESNPNTFNNILGIVFIIILLIICTLIIKFTKDKELFIVLFILLSLPTIVFALERLKITINTKITVGEMYNVYYFVGYNIKASDLNDKDYVYDNCVKVPIKQGDSDFENYMACNYIFKKDPKSYFDGQRVKVEPLYYLKYDENEENSFTCSGESPYVLLHNTKIENMMYFCYEPDSEFANQISGSNNEMTKIFNTCNNEEFNKMNFQSTVDYTNFLNQNVTAEEAELEFEYLRQQGMHITILNLPNEFTMPAHDLYFFSEVPTRKLGPCM